ncbi:MAG: aspartate/glutamate racemase family protein, partial [Ignavibacteria bacterium]
MKYKILGLIGGIGPESTIDYYKMIIKKFRERFATNDYPHFLINNINLTEMLSYVKENKLDVLSGFLAKEIKKLEEAGADFGALASNTPHIVFDELQKKVNLPLLSIVEECFKEISRKKIKRVGLFGTLSTMDGGFYQTTGRKYSIEVITSDKKSKEYINKIYFEELVLGIINPSTKKELINIVSRMKDNDEIKGLILGGTEL